MTRSFDRRLFTWLSLSFVLATIIGTLSHELGHYIVARLTGYDATIHYGYTHIDFQLRWSDWMSEAARTFPQEYTRVTAQISRHALWIAVGGPLQTMLTGTIGLILLFRFKRSFKEREQLSPRQWFLVFITLFWLRQTANMLVWLTHLITAGQSHHGDEIDIASILQIPWWSLVVATGLIGGLVLYVVIFEFVPRMQRLTFIAAGMAGGLSGYVLWLYLLGPAVLP